MTSSRPAVLIDLDGTLVDSVFQHVITWSETLQAAGYEVPLWRIHAGIGMGSSMLVPWLLGRHPDDLDALADEHERRFLERAAQLRPTVGALAFVEDLERRDVPHVIATSARAPVRKALLEALGRQDLETLDEGDVDEAKPAPDLLLAGARALGAEPSWCTLIGDSPWDAEAAGMAGMRMIGVRCGGFGDDRLLHAGAADVVDDPRALVGRL